MAHSSSEVSARSSHAYLRNDCTAIPSVQSAILAPIREDNTPVLSRDLGLETDGSSSPNFSDIEGIQEMEEVVPEVTVK